MSFDHPNATKEELFALAEEFEKNKNDEKALAYYDKASEMGHTTATRYAGYLCRVLAGKSSSANNNYAVKAVTYYTKAASEPMNDARAMTVMGYFYEKGLTTSGGDVITSSSSPPNSSATTTAPGLTIAPDNKKASEWYNKAIATGNDDGTAAVNLALLYEKGKLSPSGTASLDDKKTAFELFKSVADKPSCKNSAALINAGLYYEKGEKEGVVPKDMTIALNNYYLKAAKLGDTTAFAIVGCCFETGQGCKVDYDVAADFYVRGAMAGNGHAKEGLRRLRDAGHI